MRIRRGELIVNYAVLILFSAGAVVPLIGVLFSSVTPVSQAGPGFALPRRVDVGTYAQAWRQGHFGSYMVSSVVVTASVVALTACLAIIAGFAFVRFRFPGSSLLFYVLLLGLMLPEEAFVIPLYYDLRDAGLTDTYASLILPQVAQSLGFGVFWMRNCFRQYPVSVMEAARLDGASEWQLLWRVLVPASRPAVLTMCLMVALWTWNEFLIPLVMITGDSMRTAPLALAFFQGQHTTQFSLLAAASVIVALPVVVLYVFLQRHFVAGLMNGALKE